MSAAGSSPTSPVAFIGLGQMGAPLAERLVHAAVPVWVSARERGRAEPLLSLGASWAESPRALGRAVPGGVAFTCLPDAKALASVLFGRKGLALGLGSGGLVVDLSTVAPEQSRAAAERLRSRGIGFVDAPMGGSVGAAREGRLLLFVGGADGDVARARPYLALLGRRVEHLGGVGAGTSMKLVNNLLTLGTTALDAEALALADGLGLDPRRVIELLLDGGGRSAMLEMKRTAFEERRYPSQFRLPLARKDLRLIEATARAVGRGARLSREVRRLVEEAVAAGHADEDFSVVLEAALRRGRPLAEASPAPGSNVTPGS